MLYKIVKSENPDLSHDQIMHYVAFHFDSTLNGDVIMGDMTGDESLWDKIKNSFR